MLYCASHIVEVQLMFLMEDLQKKRSKGVQVATTATEAGS